MFMLRVSRLTMFLFLCVVIIQIVLEEEARRRLDTSRKSECLIRPMGAADSSCTEASDIDRRAVRAFSKRRTASALGSSR